jgi:hypothetical protein
MKLYEAENSLLALERKVKELRKLKQEQETQARYERYSFLSRFTVDGLQYDVGFSNVNKYLSDQNGYLLITISGDNEYNCLFFASEDKFLQSLSEIITDEYSPVETEIYHAGQRYNYIMKLTLVPMEQTQN